MNPYRDFLRVMHCESAMSRVIESQYSHRVANSRGIFKTQLNIYDQLKAVNCFYKNATL